MHLDTIRCFPGQIKAGACCGAGNRKQYLSGCISGLPVPIPMSPAARFRMLNPELDEWQAGIIGELEAVCPGTDRHMTKSGESVNRQKQR